MNTPLTFAVVAAIVAALPATSMAEPTTIYVAGGLVFEFNPGADNCKLDDSHLSDWKLLHDRREASTPGSSYVVAIFIPCAQLAAFRAGTVDPTDLGILVVLNAKNGVAKQLKGADRPSVLDIAANTYRTEKVSVDAAKATARTQGDDPSEVVPFEPLGVLHIDDTAVYFGYRLPAEPTLRDAVRG